MIKGTQISKAFVNILKNIKGKTIHWLDRLDNSQGRQATMSGRILRIVSSEIELTLVK